MLVHANWVDMMIIIMCVLRLQFFLLPVRDSCADAQVQVRGERERAVWMTDNS